MGASSAVAASVEFAASAEFDAASAGSSCTAAEFLAAAAAEFLAAAAKAGRAFAWMRYGTLRVPQQTTVVRVRILRYSQAEQTESANERRRGPLSSF